MAPEQARGEDVDARADVFALGVVLYECLAGQRPFVAEHPIAALARMLFEDAPRVSERRADVPAALDALVARMLSKDRALRPRDGGAVVEALAQSTAATDPTQMAAAFGAERRVVSVVFTRPAHAADATIEIDVRRELEERAEDVARSHGGAIDALANGSFVVVFRGDESPTDQAVRGARCALALSSLLGADAVALATSRAVVAGAVLRARRAFPARR
jgi:hypothetical protein